MKTLSTNAFFALFLVTIGAVGRIALQDYPNVETVMVVTFIAMVYLREWYALLVPLASLGISDFFLGNLSVNSQYSLILLFTYTGFILVALVSRRYRTYFRNNSKKLNMGSLANTSMFGILFVLVFDLWTNLGAFLLMYPNTLHGLMLCYTMAVPFMFYHLFSGAVTFALIVAPASSLIDESHILDSHRENPIPTPD